MRSALAAALCAAALLGAAEAKRKKMSKKEQSVQLDLALDPPEDYAECIEKMGGEGMATAYGPDPDLECAQCLQGCESMCGPEMDREACFACVRPGCDVPCIMLNNADGQRGGLTHHLCKWWADGGSSVLCNRISDEVQCRRFGRLNADKSIVLDPFLNQTRIRQFHHICDGDGDEPICMDQNTIAEYYTLAPKAHGRTEDDLVEEFLEEQDSGRSVEHVEGAFDKDWAELDAEQHAAAKLIGYTKTNWYEPAPPTGVLWSDLTESQVGAAELIGWDSELWANELEAAGGPLEAKKISGETTQIVEGVFDKEWTGLSSAEAKAAKKLGYTKKTWYDSAPPKLVPYSELSSAEQKAGAVLGWEEELWNNELKAVQEEGGGAAEEADDEEEEDDELVEVSGAFDKEWTELSKSEAKAAKRLGYTASSWYDNAPPRLVAWDVLSKAQVKAATKLGW